MLQDIRYAWRSLTRSPGFASVAVATLAVAIGLNASLFSIVNVMLFKPLPVERGDQLIWISSASTKPNGPRGNMTHPDVVDLSSIDVFAGVTAYGPFDASVAAREQALRLEGHVVMGNFFNVLGVEAHRGRLIEAADDRPSADPIIAISYALWQRMFGGADDAVGQTVRVNGRPFTVAGVVAPGFRGPEVLGHVDVWIPVSAAKEAVMRNPTGRNVWWLKSIARLRSGRTVDEAGAAVRARAVATAQAFPDSHDGFTMRVDAVRGTPPGDRAEVAPLSALLLGVTMTVLLIACANVANLLLVRGIGQGREIAIRVALGAKRARLIRQHLLESGSLAVAGGALGLLLSLWTTDLLIRFAGAPIEADFTPDRRVLWFTLGLSAATALIFGVVPALRASGVAPGAALKTEHGASDARPRSRMQGALVSGQLALSLVLLLAAALFLKSLVSARHVDVGFAARDRVAMSFNLRMHGYSAERAQAFYRTLLDRVRSRPGVRSASLAMLVPLGGRVHMNDLTLPDRPQDPNARRPTVAFNIVWPEFFETLEIRILKGRALNETDMREPATTAVVSEALAQRHWPDRDPIGQRFSIDGPRGPFLEVVGVARDTTVDELTENVTPMAYLPGSRGADDVALLAWIEGEPASALRRLESDVRALDGSVAVFEAKTLQQHLADRFEGERGLSRILGLMGTVALSLAAMGLYGAVAYTVARRTREIGVRVALGAERRDVIGLFIHDAARLALVGLGVGLLPAIGVTALLAGSLVGVRVADPIAMGAAILVLAAVTLVAAYIPARRAVGIDPIAALRAE
jgi:predicted permease